MTRASARPGPVEPTRSAQVALRPAPGVRIDGGFWGRYQVLNREVTIPHGIAMLEESGTMANLRMAAGEATGEYTLPLFRDTDVYKLLEAIAWDRQNTGGGTAEGFFADAAALLARAQRPDGYLNSHYQVAEPGKRFTNPAMGHELYCFGHLLQAAVADLRTGGRALAGVANRVADLLADQLPGPLADFVPGHPEIETALAEFSRATGRTELVEMAADLVARRGRSTLSWHSFGPEYFSDDVPFADATHIRGHAVRALYLLAGATDVHAETGRRDLLTAALAQWDDMVGAKTYLTGGVGSRHEDEAFGAPFELPPDHAYCETCAAIASIQWNWRMLLATGEARFAELMERTLFNGFLSGLGLDGRGFFYVNPLQSRADGARRPWYTCACCPPNIMRLLAGLGHYVATTAGEGVQIHQYVTGRLTAGLPGAGTVELAMTTGYPDTGDLSVRVLTAPAGEAELAIRVPSWAPDVSGTLNGHPLAGEPGVDRYLRLRRRWEAGDELTLELPLPIRTVHPHPDIDAVRKCVAIERGPLVYCLESADLPGADDDIAAVAAYTEETPVERGHMDIAGRPVMALSVPGRISGTTHSGWPYYPDSAAPTAETVELPLTVIPYYAWANRRPGAMRVWLPRA